MRRARAPLLATCIVLALAGCGGDDADQQTSTAAAREGQAATASPKAKEPASGNGRPEGATAQSTTAADAGPEPGTKSVAPGVPVQPGGDDSIQTFGAEGEVDQREQALANLEAYLKAKAARRWPEACDATSQEFRSQLAALMARAQGKKKPKGCAETLERFFESVPRAQLRRAAEVNKLLSFRVRGKYAYLIFKGAGDTVNYIAMANDDGKWKVNVPTPEPFSSASG